MDTTITIPAGVRVRDLETGRIERTEAALTVRAAHRVEDDTWLWVANGVVYEVRLAPGD